MRELRKVRIVKKVIAIVKTEDSWEERLIVSKFEGMTMRGVSMSLIKMKVMTDRARECTE